MAVAALVIEHGGNEDQAVAALLHDAVEDQGGETTLNVIKAAFGDAVAQIVSDCTDAWGAPISPWTARKQAYLASLPGKPEASLLVSLADKTHNAEAIQCDYGELGDGLWDRFNGGAEGTIWYYRALADIFLNILPGPLSDRLSRAVSAFPDVSVSTPPKGNALPVARNTTPAFARFIGIDYSGAETPNASLKGLRVYLTSGDAPPVEVLPPPSPRKYWTRKGVAHWLVERLSEDVPTLVGIDHAFSFPLRYFEDNGLELDWPKFLDDFQGHWPTDEDNTYVDFVRDGVVGSGAARMGDARWKRLTDIRAGGAKSVFHFDVPGQVAKSTHAGIPWLRFIRRKIGDRTHFWPFDGWDIPNRRSAIAEVYPALWSQEFAPENRSGDQHDAYSVSAWLSRADQDGRLNRMFNPLLRSSERTTAQVEGWILGVE
jgi:hypothetical protein